MTKLTLIDRALFLKRTPLFGTMDLDLLLAIADKVQVISYEGDQTIFRVGEEAYRMYFVASGAVEIRNEEAALLGLLHTGEFFGDESIFNEQPRAYEAVTQMDSILLAISKATLLNIISECPSVAVGLLQAYTSSTAFRPRKPE